MDRVCPYLVIRHYQQSIECPKNTCLDDFLQHNSFVLINMKQSIRGTYSLIFVYVHTRPRLWKPYPCLHCVLMKIKLSFELLLPLDTSIHTRLANWALHLPNLIVAPQLSKRQKANPTSGEERVQEGQRIRPHLVGG